ncbi:MAG TPA: EsaB/YukD family protein, partial [Actinomycetes bacterium]|nr:EsaB/YukD family protein [Actinomycetes bacterium]
GAGGHDPPGPGRAMALAPLAEAPLPTDRTLAACGVGDGAVLVLVDLVPPGAGQAAGLTRHRPDAAPA